MKAMIGILGGMGPLATVDFLGKLVERTPAARDQEHVPVVVYSVPQIPDRSASILGGTESPLPAMRAGILTLERAGARAIAIACNTAHYWFDDLSRECRVPLLHIADCACAALGSGVANVGLLATRGTLAAGFYQQRLISRGYRCLISRQDEIDTWVNPGIGLVKAGNIQGGGALLRQALAALFERGAQRDDTRLHRDSARAGSCRRAAAFPLHRCNRRLGRRLYPMVDTERGGGAGCIAWRQSGLRTSSAWLRHAISS